MNRFPHPSIAVLLFIAITVMLGRFSLNINAQGTQNITSVQWSPDGSRIVSANDDGYLEIWDAISGGLLQEFQGHAGTVNTISWSPDSTRFASASPIDKVVRIWNSITSELIERWS